MKYKKNKLTEVNGNGSVATLEASVSGEKDQKDIQVISELEGVIHGFNDDNEPWTELTIISNASRTGAAFRLTRPCEVGRLVKLTASMPRELRGFDHDEKHYTVVGLVQYCTHSESDGEFIVGVAFLGRDFPDSFFENPMQSYRISGSNANGMWTASETETDFTKRRHARYIAHLHVTISLLQKNHGIARQREDTITFDISADGACVASSLDVKIGERVKFACKELNFYAMAIVRDREMRNKRLALHLEFVEHLFPVKKLPNFAERQQEEKE